MPDHSTEGQDGRVLYEVPSRAGKRPPYFEGSHYQAQAIGGPECNSGGTGGETDYTLHPVGAQCADSHRRDGSSQGLTIGGTAAADTVASVYADPNIIFEVQHDGTGTAAMNNSAFDFVGVAGSAITGQSTSELDTSTSGSSGGFKQIGISKDPDNSDVASANANAYVVFNTGEHVFKLTTGV